MHASLLCLAGFTLASLLARPVHPLPFTGWRQPSEREGLELLANRRSGSSSTSSAAAQSTTNPDYSYYDQFQHEVPEAIRGPLGATETGPKNTELDRQNPDMLAPPSTDSGSIPNAKWPFALSHNRLTDAGWARQQNVQVMPVATELAGVNMRLEEGAIREMHWHTAAEWSYMLNGSARVSGIDYDGRNYIADVNPGDTWYFPAGIPHVIQALKGGCEFLLVFDDGAFSEDATLLLTDWTAHTPKEVLAKNFGLPMSAFAHIPSSGNTKYIFPAALPQGSAADQAVSDPNGTVPNPFTFPWSKVDVARAPGGGGGVKVLDSTTFHASKTIAAALVEVEPNGMRELHWHPNSDEWTYWLQGHARITVFAGQSNARTFNFQAGDTGYIPASQGHYVENIGNETLKYLEIFKSDVYEDVSLAQWLALTPASIVQAHLGLSDETIAELKKEKALVVPGTKSNVAQVRA